MLQKIFGNFTKSFAIFSFYLDCNDKYNISSCYTICGDKYIYNWLQARWRGAIAGTHPVKSQEELITKFYWKVTSLALLVLG